MSGEPVCFGVGLPRGSGLGGVVLLAPGGGRFLCQTEVTAWWGDGSPQWVLVEAVLGFGVTDDGPDEGEGSAGVLLPTGSSVAVADKGDGRVDAKEAVSEGIRAAHVVPLRSVGDTVEVNAPDSDMESNAEGWFLEVFAESDLECGETEVRQLQVDASDSEIRVNTGRVRFHFPQRGPGLMSQFRVGETGDEVPADCGIQVTSQSNQRHQFHCEKWRVESSGPVRCTLAGEGTFPGIAGLRGELRLNCYAGTDLLKIELTIHNFQRAQHKGGLWDLGDVGSILIKDCSLQFRFDERHAVQELHYSLDRGETTRASQSGAWSLYQDSSGGENWQSAVHVNRDGNVPCRFRGYQVTDGAGDTIAQGFRAVPIVSCRSDWGSLQIAIPEFWEQFPTALTVEPNQVRVAFFPQEFADLHELQGGEKKTSTTWLRFSNGSCALESFSWVHRPSIIAPTQEWCDSTSAITPLELPESPEKEEFNQLFQDSIWGERGILANRETVDEYGWRNYGDIFADHEEAYYKGDDQLISHYNNQYDMVLGFLLHYLRTGERRLFELGDTLARHVVDIDLYHTTEDKAAYNGGHFWLTDHYLHARTATHRTYSQKNIPANGTYGGGPGAEHNFTSGLKLHYHLTGNVHSKEAVLQLAQWVINMDNGRLTILGVLDDSETGLATGSAVYQGPNRGGGFSINALLDAWSLTQNRDYLDYAEKLIRRCVHPHADIAQHDLLQVESRWSYTAFLTAVEKYLTLKQAANELDQMYAYVQASLLHFARWMLAHERPYFDQVEKLEYPTEAWAVQEFRKANVLRHAARHATGLLQEELQQRGRELADRAWSDLLSFETRTYARALAVMMTEGIWDLHYRGGKKMPAQRAPEAYYTDFGVPEVFEPQKQKIKSLIKNPVGLMFRLPNLLQPSRWRKALHRGS